MHTVVPDKTADDAANAGIIEVFIERWVKTGASAYPWSIWRDGRQVMSSHGRGEYGDPDQSEMDAVLVCERLFGRKPDTLERL